MLITINSPDGTRRGAEPESGIKDDITLVRSLLVTLAAERMVGHARVTLTVDLANVDARKLVAIARQLRELDLDPPVVVRSEAGIGATVHTLAPAASRGS